MTWWRPNAGSEEKALDSELRNHLELQAAEYVAEGMSEDEARRRAALHFGDLQLAKEECRSVRPLHWLTTAGQDVRMAGRLFQRSPIFVLVCVLTISLCVAANTTVFSIANGIALKEPPFTEPQRVMHIEQFDLLEGPGARYGGVSYPDFLDFREQSRSFSDMALHRQATFNISDDRDTPRQVEGNEITPNLFSLLGYRPVIGRDFLAGEDQPGAARVVIISHALWQTRHGGARDVLGRELRIDGTRHTIVGVMAAGMRFPVRSDLWVPVAPSEEERDRGFRGRFDVVGRLRDGVSADQAQADVEEIARRLRVAYPESNEDITARVIPFRQRYSDPGNATVFTALFGAVGFVLLIACANLAGLMLARAFGRTRETAIRLALGAGRGRIVRQFLVESLVLTTMGGCVGFALAFIVIRVLEGELSGVGMTYWTSFSVDYRVVAELLAVCVLTGVLVALWPALRIARTDPHPRLKEGTSAGGVSPRAVRLASLLITAEVALTLVLLVGAGFMIRNFLDFQLRDPGVPTEELLTATFLLSATDYPEEEDGLRFQRQLMTRLRAQPGLQPLTLASHAPLIGSFRRTVETGEIEPLSVETRVVAPGYFETTGIRIVRGREFAETDGRPGNSVAVVSERFASMRWPDGNPLEEQFRFGDAPQARALSVIGVAADVPKWNGNVAPAVYVPYTQEPIRSAVIISRSPSSRDAVLSLLRSEVQALDPNLPLFDIRTIDEYLWALSVGNRVLGALFSAFALIALMISLVGIYGTTAYSLVRQNRALAVRMALGATRSSVLWLSVRRSLWYSAPGVALGLAGAWAVSLVLLAGMAPGLPGSASPTDISTILLASLLLALMTTVACFIPARRATRVQLIEVLRDE